MDDNFYLTNTKYKELHEQLDYKYRHLLTDVVGDAIQHGIRVLAKSLNIEEPKK
jgi:hypothetical protein